jgi:hypothetical protein
MNRDITLLGIDGTGTELDCYLKVFELCSKEFNFKKFKLITASETIPSSNFIEFFKIDKLNYKQYQAFCILDTANYIDTDYALFVQSDGFIANGDRWSDEYLNYDYVGQPWMHDSKKMVYPWIKDNAESVGEGGFSLRSKRLLDFCSNLDQKSIKNLTEQGNNEDFIICVTARNLLKENGFKFCTPELGKQFCAGNTPFDANKINNTFGFHGNFYLPSVLEKYKEKHGIDYINTFTNYNNIR